jgi:predicted  nucleic acid-binding Zn-ribbon protein
MDELEREFREWFHGELGDAEFREQRSDYEKALCAYRAGAQRSPLAELVEELKQEIHSLQIQVDEIDEKVKEAYEQGRDSQKRGLKSRYA